MSASGTVPSLPRWQSHKVVEASKITGVSEVLPAGGLAQGVLFVWHLECGVQIDVDEALASRVKPHTPAVGGYYVRYPDGYQSWSPADAFEGGYTPYQGDA